MRKLLSRHEISEIYEECDGYCCLFEDRLIEYGYHHEQIVYIANQLFDGEYKLPCRTKDEYQRSLHFYP